MGTEYTFSGVEITEIGKTMKKQTPEEYARQRFEKWWDAEQDTHMTHSRYLARKAWMAAWFTRLTVKSSNAQAHQTPERSVGGMVPPVVGTSGRKDGE